MRNFCFVKNIRLLGGAILGLVTLAMLGVAFAGSKTFGTAGTDGTDALAGPDGRPSLDVAIYADGNSQSYLLTGGDGGPGLNGTDATPATECEVKEWPNNNLVGAHGGRGGHGGHGGRGADGAKATVFVPDDLEASRSVLEKIFINSAPGRGGFGGRGGQGSAACICPQLKWTKLRTREVRSKEPVCRYYNAVQRGPRRPPDGGNEDPIILGQPHQIGGNRAPEDPDCIRYNLSTGLCVLHKLRPQERCYRWNVRGHCIGWHGSPEPRLPKEAVCEESDVYDRHCVHWSVIKNNRRCVEGGNGTCIDFVSEFGTMAKGQCAYELVPYKVREEKEYKCQSGTAGQPGKDGEHGKTGQAGALYIVTHGQKIKPDIKTDQLVLSPHSINQQGLELGVNDWEKAAGASSLLANGSYVDDTYFVYAGRQQVDLSFRADHQADWPAVMYQTPVHFSLKPSYKVEARFMDTLWVDYSLQPTVAGEPEQQLMHIKKVLMSHQVKEIEPVELKGVGSSAELHIKDPLLHLGFVRTRVHLQTKWDLLTSRKHYDRWVPNEFIRQQGDRVIVQIGRLPVKSKYFQKGRKGWIFGRSTKLTATLERSTVHGKRELVGTFKVEKPLGVTGVSTKIERIDIMTNLKE